MLLIWPTDLRIVFIIEHKQAASNRATAVAMLTTLALLALIALLGYGFLTWNYGYWRKRKVPGPKPAILTGNYPNLFTMKQHSTCDLNEIYK